MTSRRLLFLFLPACLALLAGAAQAQTFGLAGAAGGTPPVTAALVAEVTAAAPGQAFRAAVRLDHGPEWHTYGKVLPPDVVGKPTSLRWELPEGWTVEELPWPEPHEVPSTDGKTSIGYDGTVYLPVKITPAGEATGTAELAVKVDALACDPKSCMPVRPEASLTLALAAEPVANTELAAVFAELPGTDAPTPTEAETSSAAEAPQAAARHSFGVYLIYAFLGGLILNVMPCVFPVLGIKIMGVVRQAGEDKRQVVLHGLAYTLGILVCFWALGALVVLLGNGWGTQLQNPHFVYFLAAFFLMFALNMAGVFEIGASAVGVGAGLQNKQGLSGSFFTGLLAVVVAAPCSAPYLGAALGFAVTLAMPQALLMFSMIGLGLAAPFLLLSFAPHLVSALPRPGAWMESFKQGMSFLLFGTVAFMVWILTGLIAGHPLLFVLFGLVLVALACWIYGRWCLPHKPPQTRRLALGLAVLALAGGLWLGYPGSDAQAATPAAAAADDLWQDWSPEKVAELREQGVPVYIDFTAKWCATCQFNKRVYGYESVKMAIQEKNIALLRADWTASDPRITEALAALGKAAVPVNVLYVPGQEKPVVLSELLTERGMLEAFAQMP